MSGYLFTINIDDSTRGAILAEAEASGVSPDVLAGAMLRDAVEKQRDYEAWMMRQVEQAMLDCDDPSIEKIPHEVVMAESRAQIEAWRARHAALAA